jgi:hypothetical protein
MPGVQADTTMDSHAELRLPADPLRNYSRRRDWKDDTNTPTEAIRPLGVATKDPSGQRSSGGPRSMTRTSAPWFREK